ncbi:MAG: transposase [Candidatus Aerophobetes bacterium]|nr:transposase [Candidatus Aerophobetes bacterium]
MAQPPHFEIDGMIYFVSTRIANIGRTFNRSEMKLIDGTIKELTREGYFVLIAYVIMPDHLHILLKPVKDGISKIMQMIKGRSSKAINKGKFWQKGFYDLTLFSEDKFKKKFNYIHYNPVKVGLAERAENYKFSSAMYYKNRYGAVFYE